MPSTTQTEDPKEPRPELVPPRARLEEMLGRDFTDFLLEVLSDGHQGRRGSSSP